jgi:hypothetical protein
MQPLVRTLQDHDLGHLRVVSELWGFDPPSGTAPLAARELSTRMLEPDALIDMLASLPGDALQVLHSLATHRGRLPLADLRRRFGELREVGAGRRDREKPWRSPVSPLETLWYRGLLARAFGDTPSGPCEFGFIPSDLLPLIPAAPVPEPDLFGHPAEAPTHWHPAAATAVDDAATLLAALRRRPARDDPPSAAWGSAVEIHLHQPASAPLLITLLREQGVLQSGPLRPIAAATKTWLALPRATAQRDLLRQWADSDSCNDLSMVPGLACGRDRWPNDPLASRQVVLGWLTTLPRQTWWDVDAFVAAARERQPGFQRPGGDFDSWYLRRRTPQGEFLRGFEHWEAVEGAYLRHLIAGPLFALGAADLVRDESGARPIAFRLTPAFDSLHHEGSSETTGEASAACTLEPDGTVGVPRLASRAQRYLIARFCRWQSLAPQSYTYRLTPRSLESAARQGLKAQHVVSVLEAATSAPVPPALRRAIERALTRGPEAELQATLVLRLEHARILEELRRNRTTSRYLGEPLGAKSVAVRRRDWQALCAAAARLGLLIEPPHE